VRDRGQCQQLRCHARNKLKHTFLETTTLTITAVVDIWAGTDEGTLAVERLGNTENCKCIIQLRGYLGLLPRG